MDTEVLRTAIRLAGRAPSVHNSQPWKFVAEGDAIHLFVDRCRTVPATDHSGRETLISCGAVLDHLRIAMQALGWDSHTTRFPNPGNAGHLATVDFTPTDHIMRVQRNRAKAILHRRTDRLPLDRPAFWDWFEPTLRNTVGGDVATIDVLADHHRRQLADASRLTASLRVDDPSYHAELDWWTSPFVLSEGVPPSALASDTESLRVGVGRDFPVRGHQDRRPEIAADWSKIVVLSTPQDTAADVLRCGEVLSTVLLECTMAGMATCTLTHLIETEQGRDIVRRLIGGSGEPQALIRVGIAPPMESPAPPTPRRPLDAVLEIRQIQDRLSR
ncbi:Acg family FMN-binding oxidoreductase [Mycobacterium vicinigordonae]|uniref:NAD(P)H nitroreductase n=1 Tax=Mycobacterium vicinigordonae TaxID=1719132 RepID=A0A7D6E1E8_9MYCO|nr:NAD(P)H nitroreductase [Mycobacterium vicinigordonae]QLL08749.1 NAD(P)H nitroreductase [Mycobacterium vicinigordonae]